MKRLHMFAITVSILFPVSMVDSGAQERRLPSLIRALDHDGDGELSTNEIEQASASLRALDVDGDGKLARNERRRIPEVNAKRLAGAPVITHGPILGRPTTDGMSVWVRTSKPAAFVIHYGLDPIDLNQISETSSTKLEDDNTGIVTLSGLQSNTRYYYQARIANNGAAAPSGSFRTLPSPNHYRHEELNPDGLFNFNFEFACGNNQNPEAGNGPSLPVYNTLLRQVRDKVHFQILNGDWLYEDQREYPIDAWREQNGVTEEAMPRITQLAPTISGVWENYKRYLSRAPNLSEWHRHVPAFYTADDHELVNDIFGSGTPGFKNRRAVFRDIGMRAWEDYLAWANPRAHDAPAWFGKAQLRKDSDVLTDPNATFTQLPLEEMSNLHVHWGGPRAGVMKPEPDASEANPNYNVYRIVEVIDDQRLRIEPNAVADGDASYSIGRRQYGQFRIANCEFFFLDTRTDRELHDFDHPDKPGLSMLGKPQLEWLMTSMQASDADFHFVVSSVNFMVPHVGAGGEADRNQGAKKDDAWTVFLEEREKLIHFWDGLGKRVFVLTGDLHNSFAIKITDNVWEFASGPHNSVNHRPIEDEGNRPANGTFQYGPRPCEIRWSTYVMSDIPRSNRLFPHYCVVSIHNVFNNPIELDGERWVTYPIPYVIFQYHDAKTGDFRYSETIHAVR